MQVQSLGQEDPLKEEMAIHSSILVWEIPRTEEPGGLQSMGFSRQEYWSGLPFTSPFVVVVSQSVQSLSHVPLFATP